MVMGLTRLAVALLGALALGVATGGCGSKEGARGVASYVGRASNAVVIIQWKRTGNTVSGSLQEAILKHAEGSETSSAFTGTVSGIGLTLNLKEGLGATKRLVGQLTPSGLTLTFPGVGKRLTVIRFAPGEGNDFAAAVRKLESPQDIAAAEERTRSSESTPPGSKPPTIDTARVERSIERGILAQSNLHATVTCPASVEAKKGKTFECTAITHAATPPYAEIKTTVVVTIHNNKGFVSFESK
jgi:hypothetical protein